MESENMSVSIEQPLAKKPYYVPHPESRGKYIALAFGTLGIYNLVWFYRYWKFFKGKYDLDVSPFWRAFFAYFWIYPLFRMIKEDLQKRGYETGFNPALLAFGFFLVSIFYKFPEPWSAIATFSFRRAMSWSDWSPEAKRGSRASTDGNG
jgi:hypothetical protein